MREDRRYAPILHTGFSENYTEAEMVKFVRLVDERGYSGFSVEGKASSAPVPADKVDDWIDGYMRGLGCACREAEARGLDVWIFDEWGYPTGTAAGKAMAGRPYLRSKKLHCAIDMIIEEGQTVSFTAPRHLLAAAAWHVNRNVFAGPAGGYEVIPVRDGRIEYTAAHRRCRLVAASWEYDTTRTVGVFEHDMEDDAQCTLDLLSREAVESLLDVMHGEYERRLGEHLGRAIKGFFYDEPFLSFPRPYTFDLIENFIKIKGYDPTPRLPLLVSGGGGRLYEDWRDVATTMMAEVFFGGMQRWCHAHGVELVGHQDLDHDVRSTNSVSGDFFKNNKYNDAPGVDYIWAQIRPDHTADYPRLAGSFRRMCGKAHATSESFAAVGRCLTPDYMRWAMEYQAVRGVDRFYLMIAAPEGGRGFGTPLDFSHPVSRLFARDVNAHVSKAVALLSEGSPAAEIALYIPRDRMSAEYPPARANRVSLHMPWEWFNDTAEALLYAPVDFDYIWDDVIAEAAVGEDGSLSVPSGQRLRTVVVPAVYALPERVAGKLHEMQARGGEVIFVSFASEGFVGSRVCTYPCDVGKYLGGRGRVIGGGGRVSLTSRVDCAGRVYYLLLNESMSPFEGTLSLPDEGAESYDFRAGEWRPARRGAIRLEPLELAAVRGADVDAARIPLREKAVTITRWRATWPNGTFELEATDGVLPDWRGFAGDYSGVVTYEAGFDATGGEYELSLGRVFWAARVSVDGGGFISLPFAPYVTNLSLGGGRHTLTVEVLNADAASVLGSPEAELRSRERREFKDIFENDRDFVASGLVGPVTLTLIKRYE